MKIEKSDRYALIGTVVFSAIVLFLLFNLSMKFIQPPQEEQEVTFEEQLVEEHLFEPTPPAEVLSTDNSSGAKGANAAPASTPKVAPQTQSPKPKASTQPNIKTQNVESSYKLAQAQKEAKRKEEEEQQKKLAIENARKADEAAARARSAFANTTNATGTDREGSGNATSGSGTGVSVSGVGGRGTKSLPRPQYTVDESGIVVIGITVDASGNVIKTEVQLKGTTTSSRELRKAAENAAKQTKFTADPGANNVTGAVTYRFNLR